MFAPGWGAAGGGSGTLLAPGWGAAGGGSGTAPSLFGFTLSMLKKLQMSRRTYSIAGATSYRRMGWCPYVMVTWNESGLVAGVQTLVLQGRIIPQPHGCCFCRNPSTVFSFLYVLCRFWKIAAFREIYTPSSVYTLVESAACMLDPMLRNIDTARNVTSVESELRLYCAAELSSLEKLKKIGIALGRSRRKVFCSNSNGFGDGVVPWPYVVTGERR